MESHVPQPRRRDSSGAVPLGRRLLAWCVHAYTAIGLILAAGMAVLIVQGGPGAFRGVLLLMVAATVVDATDGALARAVRVREVLPQFDGRQLDYLIDFLTYVTLPILLLWRTELLPGAHSLWLLAPLLAGAYWFCQVEAKTADGYFLGFPAYWNIVAFYLYALDSQVTPLPAWLTVGLLLLFSVLTFVPCRYLYTTQRGALNWLSNALGACWAVAVLWIVYRLPSAAWSADRSSSDPEPTGLSAVILLSLLFPVYYLVMSWIISVRRGRC